MDHLHLWEYVGIGLIFVWGGFVRSGVGFGGATLTLPLLLLILDSPVYVLPIIAVHLLIFGGLTLGGRLHNVDWAFLCKSFFILLPGKLVGVIGLLSMPAEWLVLIVYGVSGMYAVMFLLNIQFHSHSRWADALLLNAGGYMSGTALSGAPPIISVYARHVDHSQFRETLFVLWIVLVLIKLAAFVATDTDLQLIHHLWLLPCAAVGHVLGLRFHRYLVDLGRDAFMRWIGGALLLLTLTGFVRLLG